MLEYLQCPPHLLPRNIVIKDNQIYMALCSECLLDRQKKGQHFKGIKLNRPILQLFSTFTTYIENKMRQWAHSAKKGGIDIIFQRIVNGQCIGLDRQSGQKLNQIVVGVINHYKNLMRSNRQYVNANPNADTIYHPQFLKDIYNMVIEGWETSSLVIENNLKQKIHQTLPERYLFEYNIKTVLINEINQEKKRIVNQFAKDIVVSEREMKFRTNGLEMLGRHCSELQVQADTNQSENQDEVEQGIFDTPLVIKKVDSFLEIKEQLQSNKQIQGNGGQRRIKMKNSKLIDEDDYYCWKAKFLGNLHQIQTLKHQNERLLNENTLLANQKLSLQEDNQILRKKYEKLLHDSKQRLTSGKKQNQNVDPNSQLLLNIVELEVEVNDSRHDINILAGCLNELIKSSAVSREAIAKKLKALRTIHMHN